MSSLSGHQRPNQGASDEWYTPPEIFEALGLIFDLDPCSPLAGPVPWVPAQRFLTINDDGLKSPWGPNEIVWLNPPYGKQTIKWMARLSEHGLGVALVPARTDTQWFHKWGTKADVICFMEGRPHFYNINYERAPFNSGAPIMLLGYGMICADAVRGCGLGCVMEIVRNGKYANQPPVWDLAS